ncbi:hypothetical protein RJ55_02901 [Drechmeria coniospora]|nr:hypothetical protein RJ55_02901 [Drechmeria coniospora]
MADEPAAVPCHASTPLNAPKGTMADASHLSAPRYALPVEEPGSAGDVAALRVRVLKRMPPTVGEQCASSMNQGIFGRLASERTASPAASGDSPVRKAKPGKVCVASSIERGLRGAAGLGVPLCCGEASPDVMSNLRGHPFPSVAVLTLSEQVAVGTQEGGESVPVHIACVLERPVLRTTYGLESMWQQFRRLRRRCAEIHANHRGHCTVRIYLHLRRLLAASVPLLQGQRASSNVDCGVPYCDPGQRPAAEPSPYRLGPFFPPAFFPPGSMRLFGGALPRTEFVVVKPPHWYLESARSPIPPARSCIIRPAQPNVRPAFRHQYGARHQGSPFVVSSCSRLFLACR